MGLLEFKKNQKNNPPSHSTTRILQWKDTKSTMNADVSGSKGKKENSMLCILKDLIICNAVFLQQQLIYDFSHTAFKK